MTDRKTDMNGKRTLSDLIRGQIASDMNRRFLSRLPAFKPVGSVTDRFDALLSELDLAETRLDARRK